MKQSMEQPPQTAEVGSLSDGELLMMLGPNCPDSGRAGGVLAERNAERIRQETAIIAAYGALKKAVAPPARSSVVSQAEDPDIEDRADRPRL